MLDVVVFEVAKDISPPASSGSCIPVSSSCSSVEDMASSRSALFPDPTTSCTPMTKYAVTTNVTAYPTTIQKTPSVTFNPEYLNLHHQSLSSIPKIHRISTHKIPPQPPPPPTRSFPQSPRLSPNSSATSQSLS